MYKFNLNVKESAAAPVRSRSAAAAIEPIARPLHLTPEPLSAFGGQAERPAETLVEPRPDFPERCSETLVDHRSGFSERSAIHSERQCETLVERRSCFSERATVHSERHGETLVEQRNRLAEQRAIDMNALRRSTRKLKAGLIAPAEEETTSVLATEHAAEPIKSMEDIIRISRHLIEKEQYRDNMLFIVGINFGLRASDLRMLRFSDLINNNFVFKESFPVFEKKTRNTRKKKKNRYITINNAVIDAVTLYLEHTPNVKLSDYMFRSLSNNGAALNEPISVRSIERILKRIASELDLSIKMSTHTLRKTFGYHQMLMSGNDSRKLLLLQKIFNHSSPAQTLEYIGITQEEIADAYLNLNLGSREQNYLVDSKIGEVTYVA